MSSGEGGLPCKKVKLHCLDGNRRDVYKAWHACNTIVLPTVVVDLDCPGLIGPTFDKEKEETAPNERGVNWTRL